MTYEHEIDDVNFLIKSVGNYMAAHSIALDPYSRYRLRVMEYIIDLKKHALRLGDHEQDKPTRLVFMSLVFETFNDAQKHLKEYHEQRIQIITDHFQKVFDKKPIHPVKAAQLIATKMRRTLNGYKLKIGKMKIAIQKSLAILYKIHIKGI